MKRGSGALCLLAFLQVGTALHKGANERRVIRDDPTDAVSGRSLLNNVSRIADAIEKDPDMTDNTMLSACEEIGNDAKRHSEDLKSAIAHTGIFEAIANSMARRIESKDVLMSCANAIEDVVLNNHEATKYMWEHTGVMTGFTTVLERYSMDADMMASMMTHWGGFASACCPEYTPKIIALGGFDSLFNALNTYNWDVNVQFSVWSGLSEHSNNVEGATAIGNYGGPNAGIFKVMDSFINSPSNEPKKKRPFTLRNEIAKTLFGLLSNDPTGSFHKALIGSDLAREITLTMASEMEVRVSQDLSCKIINQLTRELDRDWQNLLAAQGAIEIIATAVVNFKVDDKTSLEAEAITDTYPVVSTCMQSLLNLVKNNKKNQEFVRRLAIKDYLEPALKERPQDTTLQHGIETLKLIIAP